jgi:hypothetical protein
LKPSKKAEQVATLNYLDEHPELTRTDESRINENDNLFYSIINGAVSTAFLKPQTGIDKRETRRGHQCEKPYLRQYYKDSREGKVPNTFLCDVRDCGLAMKNGLPYVRDSADAIAIEETQAVDDHIGEVNEESFDVMMSHPVECKCRHAKGSDGSLAKAVRIQKKIANIKGLEEQRRVERGEAVYIEVSTSQRDFLKDLIPKASELIQLLHHAFTYDSRKAAFLVGNKRGELLYGVIVNFEDDLLQSYGNAVGYLYENGLNRFYSNDISTLPTDFIESVLLRDDKLKKKYTIDDFMTSFLIWRELLPTNDTCTHRFPIPKCKCLFH